MQQHWFWTIFLLKYSSGKADSVREALFGETGPYNLHGDPGGLFLKTVGNPSETGEAQVAKRIDCACELGLDVRLFFIFYAEEAEVYLAKQVAIIDDVLIETKERLPRLLQVVQEAHLPIIFRLPIVSFVLMPILALTLLRWIRLPLEVRQKPGGSTVNEGRVPKFGTMASIGVWGTTAGGGLATGLALKFGDQPRPYDISPTCVGGISFLAMALHVVWQRGIIAIDWRPPRRR